MNLSKETYEQANQMACDTNCHELERINFSTRSFGQIVANLHQKYGYMPQAVIFGVTVWQSIIGDNDFFVCMDPVSSHEELMAGNLAFMFGMALQSDCYLNPDEQFVHPNSLLFTRHKEDGALIFAARVDLLDNNLGLRTLVNE